MRGAANMALDQALLERARTVPEGVVRVYSWAAPTLSLGRNQRAAGLYDVELARARGIDVVRRPTGGRALLHHREITYSVTAPAGDGHRMHDAYRAINHLLCSALHVLGVDARIAAGSRRTPPPGIAPCFELPSAGELVLGGRKLAGSAQYATGGSFLQHGSILVRDDQGALAALTRVPLGAIPPAATLAGALGREPSPAEFAEALFDAVRREWDGAAESLEVDAALATSVHEALGAFSADDWTWRR